MHSFQRPFCFLFLLLSGVYHIQQQQLNNKNSLYLITLLKTYNAQKVNPMLETSMILSK